MKKLLRFERGESHQHLFIRVIKVEESLFVEAETTHLMERGDKSRFLNHESGWSGINAFENERDLIRCRNLGDCGQAIYLSSVVTKKTVS